MLKKYCILTSMLCMFGMDIHTTDHPHEPPRKSQRRSYVFGHTNSVDNTILTQHIQNTPEECLRLWERLSHHQKRYAAAQAAHRAPQLLEQLIRREYIDPDDTYNNVSLASWAYRGRNDDALQTLIQAGATLDHIDDSAGQYMINAHPLMYYAIMADNQQAFINLWQRNGKYRNENGETVLHWAVQQRDPDTINYILDRKPHLLSVHNASNESPIDFIQHPEHETLIMHGSDNRSEPYRKIIRLLLTNALINNNGYTFDQILPYTHPLDYVTSTYDYEEPLIIAADENRRRMISAMRNRTESIAPNTWHYLLNSPTTMQYAGHNIESTILNSIIVSNNEQAIIHTLPRILRTPQELQQLAREDGNMQTPIGDAVRNKQFQTISRILSLSPDNSLFPRNTMHDSKLSRIFTDISYHGFMASIATGDEDLAQHICTYGNIPKIATPEIAPYADRGVHTCQVLQAINDNAEIPSYMYDAHDTRSDFIIPALIYAIEHNYDKQAHKLAHIASPMQHNNAETRTTESNIAYINNRRESVNRLIGIKKHKNNTPQHLMQQKITGNRYKH